MLGVLLGQFQHTAARRRLGTVTKTQSTKSSVSTHSRPKAAGIIFFGFRIYSVVSTHSRPKAAGALPNLVNFCAVVSTHSRPKAAGYRSI